MADEDLKAKVIIEAQDRASALINEVSRELGALGEVMNTIGSMGGMVGGALALVGAGIGAITLAGVKLSEDVEQLDKLVTRTGVSAEALQVLQEEVKLMGGDVGTLTTALTFLNRSIAQGDPLLKKMGISSKDVLTVFKQLSQVFAGSTDSAKKAEIGFQLMGRGSAELLGILPKLAGEFDQTRSAMDAAGGLMKGDVLDGARALDVQADKLRLSWDGLMTKMKSATLPTAQAVTEALNDMWDAMTGRHKTAEQEQERTLEHLQAQLEANLTFVRAARARGASEDFLKEYDDLIAKLKQKIGVVKGLTATNEDEENALMAAFDKARTAAGKGESLVGVEVTKHEPTDREKGIAEIQKHMHNTTAEATALYDALQRIADVKFAQNIKDQLTSTVEIPKQLTAMNEALDQLAQTFGIDQQAAVDAFAAMRWAEATGNAKDYSDAVAAMARLFGITEAQARDLFETVKQKGPNAITQMVQDVRDLALLFNISADAAVTMLGQLNKLDIEDRQRQIRARLGTTSPKDILKDFDKSVRDSLKLADITKSALDSIMQSLESGFSSVFQSIIAGTATAGSILKTMWHAIVDAIIQELARIAAQEVMLGIVKVLGTVLPFLATAPALPEVMLRGGTQALQTAVLGQSAQQLAANTPVRQNVQNIVVYGYDNHSIVQDLVSPRGRLRAAQGKLAFMGAY